MQVDSPSANAVQIQTLGRVSVRGASDSAGRPLAPGKPLALLVHLALAPQRRASRAALSARLWDEPDERKNSNNFRQALHQLRRMLPEQALTSRPGSDLLELGIAVDLDAIRFEHLVAAREHDAAWALYDGHFFADFALAGAIEFERWSDGVRTRLREQWLRIGELLVPERLRSGDLDGAVAIARRLRDDAPERQALWRLLITLLLQQGQVVRAAAECESLRAWLTSEDEAMERDSRDLLQRLATLPTGATATASATGEVASRRRAETIGREAVFAGLLRTWARAEAGRGSLTLLAAGPGLGKTRVLEDLRDRLRSLGATVVDVRARPLDRTLPHAVAAALVTQLATQRGAAGLSAASARVLVDLAPALSNTYPGALGALRADQSDSPSLARTLAASELVELLADEAPLAILIDDLHYADPDSYALIERLGERVSGHRAMLVAAARPSSVGGIVARESLELTPLSVDQVGALLASLAIDEAGVLPPIADAVHAATDGVPLLVLVAAELLMERGLLTIDDGAWQCRSLDAAREALRAGGMLEQLLRDVPPTSFRLLAALASAGTAIAPALLQAIGGSATDALLRDLLQRGLVQRTGTGVELAHDRVADATLAAAEPGALRLIRALLGRAVLENAADDASHLRLAARLLRDEHETDTAHAFRRWLAQSDRRDWWRRPELASRTFLGDESSTARVHALAASISWDERLRHGRPALFRLGVTAAVALAATFGGLGIAPLFRAPAVRIELSPIPNDNAFLVDRSARCQADPNTCRHSRMAIEAVLRDAEGRPALRTPDWATLRLLPDRPMRFTGAVRARIVNGRANFGTLALHSPGMLRVEVRADGLPPAVTDVMYTHGAGAGLHGHVRLLGGQLNGQPISPTQRTIVVAPGDSLYGSIRLDLLTTDPHAAMLLGAVPLWGDRTTSFFTLSSIPSIGRTRQSYLFQNAFQQFWRLRAPRVPGRYRIVLLAGAETEMKYIASGTHWARGEAIWHDGNDVADWTVDRLDELDRTGYSNRSTRWSPPAATDDPNRPDADRPWRFNASDTYATTLTVIVARSPLPSARALP